MSTLVTGTNRGLGLEFASQFAARGDRVLACCRNPASADALNALSARHPNLTVHALDVADPASVAALAQALAGTPIDLLLNNAGIYGPRGMDVGRIDYAAWAEVLAVNTLAPTRLIEALLPNVEASRRKVIACVSSKMGSMAANVGGRHHLYRSSKAALNAVVKGLSIDLRDRGVTVVTMHPGWVKTDMGGQEADLEIPDAVRSVIGVLDKLTIADSGRFLDYDGSELPW